MTSLFLFVPPRLLICFSAHGGMVSNAPIQGHYYSVGCLQRHVDVPLRGTRGLSDKATTESESDLVCGPEGYLGTETISLMNRGASHSQSYPRLSISRSHCCLCSVGYTWKLGGLRSAYENRDVHHTLRYVPGECRALFQTIQYVLPALIWLQEIPFSILV